MEFYVLEKSYQFLYSDLTIDYTDIPSQEIEIFADKEKALKRANDLATNYTLWKDDNNPIDLYVRHLKFDDDETPKIHIGDEFMPADVIESYEDLHDSFRNGYHEKEKAKFLKRIHKGICLCYDYEENTPDYQCDFVFDGLNFEQLSEKVKTLILSCDTYETVHIFQKD